MKQDNISPKISFEKMLQKMWLYFRLQQGIIIIASVLVIYLGSLAKISIGGIFIAILIIIAASIWFYQSPENNDEFRLFKRLRSQNLNRNRKISHGHGLVSGAKSLVNAIDAPIFIINKQMLIQHFNKAAGEAFESIEREAFFNQKFRNPELLRAISQAIETGTNKTLEHHSSHHDERWYLVEIAPIPGYFTQRQEPSQLADENYDFFIIFRDITQLHAVERMRSDFIANASHELRTPLASVSGYIDTLLGAAKNDETAREQFLKIMQKDSARMSRLIDDLLSLSKLEMQRNVSFEKKVNLHKILTQVINSLDPLLKNFNVEINLSISDGLKSSDLEILGDYDGLVQVFQNLVENACKYGQSGKRVDVEIKMGERGALKTLVRDYGPGIAAHHLPRLTERFYRVSVEASRAHKGTGLGLAIVKHIVNQHQGELEITSQLGKGTCFCVTFRTG